MFARAAQDDFQSACFCRWHAADIEEMHELADVPQRRIFVETETRQQHFEGHACADVRKSRAIEIKSNRRPRTARRIFEPDKLRLPIDKTPDQPGAREAIDPRPCARGPAAATVFLRIKATDNTVFGARFA